MELVTYYIYGSVLLLLVVAASNDESRSDQNELMKSFLSGGHPIFYGRQLGK